jgi:hypothetical protein
MILGKGIWKLLMKYYLDMNFVSENEIEYALKEYENNQDKRTRHVFILSHPSMNAITSKKSFFEAVIHSFPLDPPLPQSNKYSWDAIQDSLRGGLINLDEDLIDIVWNEVDAVARVSVPTLIEGVRFLLEATGKLKEFYWGKKSIKTRLLLVYKENRPGFSTGFWFP